MATSRTAGFDIEYVRGKIADGSDLVVAVSADGRRTSSFKNMYNGCWRMLLGGGAYTKRERFSIWDIDRVLGVAARWVGQGLR